MNWKRYLLQRETDEKRRKRERMNAEKKAGQLMAQADKMRAKATKAVAAQNMAKRADRLLAGLEGERRSDQVAKIRFPDPAPCGKTPLRANDLSKAYGSLEVFTAVDLAIDKGSKVVILGLNGAGKTTMLRILAGIEEPDTGEVLPGHGAATRLLRAGARDPRRLPQRAGEHDVGRPRPGRHRRCARSSARSCSPATTSRSRHGCCPAARRPGSRWRCWWSRAANVLLLDEPTNNLDPASRAEVLERDPHLRRRRRPGHARRGRRRGARARPRAAAARRRRGPVERRLRRAGIAGLIPCALPVRMSGAIGRRSCRTGR